MLAGPLVTKCIKYFLAHCLFFHMVMTWIKQRIIPSTLVNCVRRQPFDLDGHSVEPQPFESHSRAILARVFLTVSIYILLNSLQYCINYYFIQIAMLRCFINIFKEYAQCGQEKIKPSLWRTIFPLITTVAHGMKPSSSGHDWWGHGHDDGRHSTSTFLTKIHWECPRDQNAPGIILGMGLANETLQCNIVSYWLSPYPEWYLCPSSAHNCSAQGSSSAKGSRCSVNIEHPFYDQLKPPKFFSQRNVSFKWLRWRSNLKYNCCKYQHSHKSVL